MMPPFKATWTDYKKIVTTPGWGLTISRSPLSEQDLPRLDFNSIDCKLLVTVNVCFKSVH